MEFGLTETAQNPVTLAFLPYYWKAKFGRHCFRLTRSTPCFYAREPERKAVAENFASQKEGKKGHGCSVPSSTSTSRINLAFLRGCKAWDIMTFFQLLK